MFDTKSESREDQKTESPKKQKSGRRRIHVFTFLQWNTFSEHLINSNL